MEKNVGNLDRTIRIVFGAAILLAGLYAQSWFGLIGIIPIATGLWGRCPAYTPFGINTCRLDECEKKAADTPVK